MLPRVRIAMASKRNDLTLAQQYEVVKTAESERKIGVCKLGQIFGCGKTQSSTMLRNKERITLLYEANASGDRCHTSQRIRESKFSEVNEALYQWYLISIFQKTSFLMVHNSQRKQRKLSIS